MIKFKNKYRINANFNSADYYHRRSEERYINNIINTYKHIFDYIESEINTEINNCTNKQFVCILEYKLQDIYKTYYEGLIKYTDLYNIIYGILKKLGFTINYKYENIGNKLIIRY